MASSSARQTRREQLEQQRANWMQQHKQTKVDATSRPSTSSSQRQQPSIPPATIPGKRHEHTAEPNSDYECQICLTLMAGADHVPVVLFPCGHTFCRSCLDRLSKPKCPLCRQTIQSRAVNVPLQSLIAKHVRPAAPDVGDAGPANVADKYLGEYRALSMRKRALVADRKQMRVKLAQSRAEAECLSATATKLESEHSRATIELDRLRNRIQEVERQRQENAEARRRVDQERSEHEQLLQEIEGQLRPIRVGIDKSRLLFYNFRPDAVLSSDDDDDDSEGL